ncbi:MarR family transcriptional regulator [Halegenticoccus tardaugens]|uniref:MarR family transcriptional regulator n=1 Tax=Halegenticoccus tardaugens TaxID=2071624 RepID=UPI00100AAD26|nr:helix-turn-helix domain-containing protein [Halegenticoccus tardaugens]
MAEAAGRACVARQSVSARLVYTVLKHERALSQSALIEESGLSRDSVRRAVDELRACDVVEERPCLTDARRRTYRFAEVESA